MNIYCEKCNNEVHPLSNYCFYCGASAPVRTVVGDFSDPVSDDGIYCSFCGKQSPSDGAYCGKCGKSLFERPNVEKLFCPTCSEVNSVNANHCSSCRCDLSAWHNMTGVAAEKLGFTGSFTLKEKMTGITFHFIDSLAKKELMIGRSPDNDIVIPCDWVSSKHCRLDFSKKRLIDDGSGNGTYINRSSELVKQADFSDINEFNIAGSFTFNVVKTKNTFSCRLMAILDEEECNQNGDVAAYEKLRHQYFIFLSGDDAVHIRKQDGYIDEEIKPGHDYYQIQVKNGFYYYSDTARDINNRLLLKKRANWPVNWIIA